MPSSCENEPAQALHSYLTNLKRYGTTDEEHKEGDEDEEWPVAILDRLYEWIGYNTLRLNILSIDNTNINVGLTRYGVEVLHDYGERMKTDSLMKVVAYLYNVSSVPLRDMLIYAKCAQYIGETIDDDDDGDKSRNKRQNK